MTNLSVNQCYLSQIIQMSYFNYKRTKTQWFQYNGCRIYTEDCKICCETTMESETQIIIVFLTKIALCVIMTAYNQMGVEITVKLWLEKRHNVLL